MNVPCAAASVSARVDWCTACPWARMASMWRWMPACASASITGPMSTDSAAGLPMVASSIAPLSMVTTRSATLCCTHSTRRAEQRWPAESKAEAITSCTTCSGRADESTINAFWPPVSAISGTG